MKLNYLAVPLVIALIAGLTTQVGTSHAALTIVDENFDSYASTDLFDDVWTPDTGNGFTPVFGPNGILVPDTGVGLDPPNDDPPGIQGKGVNILNQINEYNGPNVGLLTNLVPTDTESIRLGGDIFDAIQGNKRTTIGLRNDTVPLAFGVFASNLIEMGFWNADTFDPLDPAPTPPDDIPSTGYAYRIALYGDRGDLPHEPNWQYFQLDPVLDIDDADPLTTEPTLDGLVSPIDIGPGWHRYETIITPTSITFTLDLFRDGKVNVTRDDNGDIEVGVGADGVDASVTWDIAPANNATEPNPFDPFTSLRFGGASGVSGNNESVVDNILLELIDVASAANADFDGNNIVDGADLLAWQRGNGILAPNAALADGDANGDLAVNGDDLEIWETQFGGAPPASAAFVTIPEPSSILLLLLAAGTFAIGRSKTRG